MRNASSMLKQRQGNAIVITGEAGSGKTALLEHFAEKAREMGFPLVISVGCPSPVGALQVGEMQPLFVFRRILEFLATQQSEGAKKRLALKLTFAALAAIPFVGEFVYSMSEIYRGVNEYKQDKKQGGSAKISAQEMMHGCGEALRKIAEDQPLILLLDNMQWSDSQSVEFLMRFAEQLGNLPILIVLAYREHEAQSARHPIFTSVESALMKSVLSQKISLSQFTSDEISECCKAYLPNYKQNSSFESWLFDHSGGLPAAVLEYVQYFQKNPALNPDGTFSEHFANGEALPATVNVLFASVIDQISEEDRILLGMCGIEGREATVHVIARLLNTDPVSAVRRLRSIQQRTGIVRSLGVQTRYGLTTTVYEFAQGFYHSFFLNSLEYEEKTMLHAQIAEILNQDFQKATLAQRELIAPYLAAHSEESGDTATFRTMMLESAKTAEKYGNSSMMEYVFGEYSENLPQEMGADEAERRTDFLRLVNKQREDILATTGADESVKVPLLPENYPAVRGAILRYYLLGDFPPALKIGDAFFKETSGELAENERIELKTLLARCFLEMGEFEEAETLLKSALKSTQDENNAPWECFALNSYAALREKQNRSDEAEVFLREAGTVALTLGKDFQLLTSANIALFLQPKDAEQSETYRITAKNLAEELQFHRFAKDAFEDFGN